MEDIKSADKQSPVHIEDSAALESASIHQASHGAEGFSFKGMFRKVDSSAFFQEALDK